MVNNIDMLLTSQSWVCCGWDNELENKCINTCFDNFYERKEGVLWEGTSGDTKMGFFPLGSVVTEDLPEETLKWRLDTQEMPVTWKGWVRSTLGITESSCKALQVQENLACLEKWKMAWPVKHREGRVGVHSQSWPNSVRGAGGGISIGLRRPGHYSQGFLFLRKTLRGNLGQGLLWVCMWTESLEADMFSRHDSYCVIPHKEGQVWTALKVDSVLSPNNPFPSLMLCRDDVCQR